MPASGIGQDGSHFASLATAERPQRETEGSVTAEGRGNSISTGTWGRHRAGVKRARGHN